MAHRRLFHSLLRRDPGRPQATRYYFESLKRKYGPFDPPTRAYAQAVVSMWWTFAQSNEELALAETKRQTGRGRRPSAQAIERLRRRQAIAFGSWDGALRQLEERAKGNGHATGPTLEQIRARYKVPG